MDLYNTSYLAIFEFSAGMNIKDESVMFRKKLN